MDFNNTGINTDLSEVIKQLNKTFENITAICENNLFDIYISKEQQQQMSLRISGYIFGIIIILSNSIVVVSSGLILKNGQQPKNTYLLLGNVSLADTLIGVAILIGLSVENLKASDMLCIFQIGMLVTQSKVSILSVGLIAVDRYIYILHGLYYQRWCSTTRVRIAILCLWVIGIGSGFLPLTGWINEDLVSTHCVYYALFPAPVIVFNSCVSLTPIFIVAVLYAIILKRVIKNFKDMKASEKPISNTGSDEQPKLRIYRGNNVANENLAKCQHEEMPSNFKRSVSFETNYCIGISYKLKINTSFNNKNIDNMTMLDANTEQDNNKNIDNKTRINVDKSDISVCAVIPNKSNAHNSSNLTITDLNKVCKNMNKRKEPNKYRAIAVVALTSCSFIFTWTPYLIVVILFAFCEEKHCNTQCMYLNSLLRGPIGFLALFNSILNPLIYAWWHKGFKKSMKAYYKKSFFKNQQLT